MEPRARPPSRWASIAAVAGLVASLGLAVPAPARAATVNVIRVDGVITPSTADFVTAAIRQAETERAEALIIELDTPGGLDTSMRDIIKEVLADKIAIVVYVWPSGARAASAGAFITMAAHVAAMAPGTNIGAATPVSMQGEMPKDLRAKAVNDAAAYMRSIAVRRGRNAKIAEEWVKQAASKTETEALQQKLIDLVAPKLEDLLAAVDGRTVALAAGPVALHTKGATLRRGEMTFRDKVLKVISDPTIAYLLFLLALAGLYFEFSTPGAILPGVLGAIALFLALWAFQTLPINITGILLIVLAIGLFIAEIKVQSHGILTLGGIASMILGSLMLIDSPAPFMRISLGAIIGTALGTAAFFLFVVGAGVRALRGPPTTGMEGLVGQRGVARTPLAPEGQVFVRGELWNARADEPVAPGEEVVIRAVEGLRLRVARGPAAPDVAGRAPR